MRESFPSAILAIFAILSISGCDTSFMKSAGITEKAPSAFTAQTEIRETPPTNLRYFTSDLVATRGLSISAGAPSNDGGKINEYSIDPSLPPGLTLETSTGTISGIPTAISTRTNYLITGKNSGGSTQTGISITVNDLAPSGLTYSVVNMVGTKGVALLPNRPTLMGGAAINYSVDKPFPAGIGLDATTGVISGTPSGILGTTAYAITARNSGGNSVAMVTLTVNEIAPANLTYPTLGGVYTVGVSIGPNAPTASGGPITSYTVSPTLPNGLTLNPTTGVISGTPTLAQNAQSYLVTARNSGGAATRTLQIAVIAAPAPSPSPSPIPSPSPTPTKPPVADEGPQPAPIGAAYYFSSSDGDDARTSTTAKNPATPWKSLAKLATILPTLTPGDGVYFKRGDTFSGSIAPTVSGTASAKIIFGSYGSGNLPIISGLVTLSGWTAVGGGIFETTCANCLSSANLLMIDGVNTPLGRWPNADAPGKGWRSISSHSGNVSITDNALLANPNWKGGELVMRTSPWTISRNPITNHVGSTISFTATSGDLPLDGYGYFIQNHPLALDQIGEWAYDPSTKKIRIFFGATNPTNRLIQISAIESLFTMKGTGHLSVNNLSFRGPNADAFRIFEAPGVSVKNCEIIGTGDYAFVSTNSPNLQIEGVNARDMNNGFLQVTGGNANSVTRGNDVRNSGAHPGMGISPNYIAISISGSSGSIIAENRISNVGYNAIHFMFGNNYDISRNYIDTFCIQKDDGGGIYTWNGGDKPTPYSGIKIHDNIVLNGRAAVDGRPEKLYYPAYGIYMDDNSTGVEISGNTVANIAGSGIFIHNSSALKITGNLVYNAGNSLADEASVGQIQFLGNSGTFPLRDIGLSGNTFVSRAANQIVLKWDTNFNDIKLFGSAASNIYARPIDDNLVARIIASGTAPFYSVAGWQAYSGTDAGSKKSAASVTNVNQLRFEFNDSSSPRTIPLERKYLGVDGTPYSGSFVLAPFRSVVLIEQ